MWVTPGFLSFYAHSCRWCRGIPSSMRWYIVMHEDDFVKESSCICIMEKSTQSKTPRIFQRSFSHLLQLSPRFFKTKTLFCAICCHRITRFWFTWNTLQLSITAATKQGNVFLYNPIHKFKLHSHKVSNSKAYDGISC